MSFPHLPLSATTTFLRLCDNMFTSSAMDVDNTVYTQEPHPIRSDHEVVPVADLWNAISSSPFYQANETYNLYERKCCLNCPLPPAAKVDREIYFVNELLQDASGDYFIPEHFFLVSYTSTGDNTDKQLYALGCTVQQTEDGFIVSDEQEIILTCNF
ncbi:uncharacterized protein F5147DRAFT_778300 [Suillus discolor]|uniref:Uncharacterized protein n=1 Tax=Suillus discolor TaxID=1912936 RepID=A0A9P7EXG9_9AGAM|nr:uncharacterized protein F5147DRAFT_778300 [Suillus discolor]KAG2096508.1 hypothetical protein F5147DRAFT_778300 [Suillus discolor]